MAYAAGESGWRTMLVWVWAAGAARLKHLAMMRDSAASRRFARLNLLCLTLGLGLVAWTRVGWAWTGGGAARASDALIRPLGEGWVRVASAPEPLPAGWPVETPTALWWNSAQAILAVIASTVTVLIVVLAWTWVMRFGVRRAHRFDYRGEQRMTAALHYGTAWIVPLMVGLLVYATQPVSYVGPLIQSSWIPPPGVFTLVVGGVTGLGLVLWWFWLIRLGFTAPANTRARVVLFFAVGAPTLTAALLTAWWLGLPYILTPLFRAMGIAAQG